jgi:DNA helicase INO80
MVDVFFQTYWKRFDRVERQQKRQQEKEAEEQQKMDLQLLEAKRQQRKLNFLITQGPILQNFFFRNLQLFVIS